MNKKIKVTLENKGMRLDIFVTENLGNITRSQIKKMIMAGDILVNDKKATVHLFLKTGDVVQIRNLKFETIINGIATLPPVARNDSDDKTGLPRSLRSLAMTVDTNGIATSATSLPPRNDIVVVAENENFFIIEKPAGLLVHPTTKNETDTLVDWLTGKYPELIKIGEDPSRAALVHRLDKDVSGLMIIPRTQDAFDYFKQQFRDHQIIKKYTALVYDNIAKDDDKIDLPIGRSKNKSGLYAAHPKDKGDKFAHKDRLALTVIKVIKRYEKYTLLEVEIFTGRTHQIRVHLLAYGHPIIGDTLYQNKRLKPANISRIFLHASQLEFIGPDGTKHKYTSELPNKLKSFLKILK